jgi:hypothetical protein
MLTAKQAGEALGYSPLAPLSHSISPLAWRGEASKSSLCRESPHPLAST